MLQPKNQPEVKAILEGNAQAFSTLVDQHKNLVFTVALRMLKNKEEAEEVAQDTFIKVYKNLDKFKGDCKLSTWIYRIAYNGCLDQLKKNKRKQTEVIYEELNSIELADTNTALTVLAQKERAQMIQAGMQRLPAKDAALLTLFYFEEKKLNEMAQVLNLTENTVKVQLFRARAKFAKLIQRHLEPETKSNHG